MTNSRRPTSWLIAALITAATWLCCAISILYFYGLTGEPALYPFQSYIGEILAVIRTSLMATVLSLGVVWIGSHRGDSPKKALLLAGVYFQASLSVYALAGWYFHTTWLTPSTFFAEYNFLTFALEVAPTTSAAGVVLLYLVGWHRTGELQIPLG